MTEVVAYQGIAGAFHEEAAKLMFGGDVVGVPSETFADVFAAVKQEEVEYGVVAVESNDPNLGHFSPVDSLFASEDVWIMGECYLAVPLSLIGIPGSRNRGLEAIHRVYSQREALMQTDRWKKAHLPSVAVEEKHDTAFSVRYVMEADDPGKVAIASAHAARRYGAEVIASPLNNRRRPRTHFFAIAPHYIENPLADQTATIITTPDVTGSLLRVLRLFDDESINLTRLDNHPVFTENEQEDPMHKAFYLNFQAGEQAPAARRVIARLQKLGCAVKVLGSYETSPTT